MLFLVLQLLGCTSVFTPSPEGESQRLSHAGHNQQTYKVAHQGTSSSNSHREYPRPLTWQPHLGRMPTANTAKEALVKLRGNPNSNTSMHFITEADRASDFFSFCLLTAHRIHRSGREEKQIAKTDCGGKSPSMTYTICDLA